MARKKKPQTEVIRAESDNFIDFVDKLSEEQRQELAQKLIGQNSPLTVVLGNYNVIDNSFALQLNGDSQDLAEQLKNIPIEAIASLTEAIAMWMRQNKPPK